PSAPRLVIGDASLPKGGPFAPHLSHQSGRDIDLAYFQVRCRRTCDHRPVSPQTFDAKRQWRLISRWLRGDKVEAIFMDYSLEEALYRAAQESGASQSELSRWFQWPRPPDARVGIIRHLDNHQDHMHVRFRCAPYDSACVSDSDR
ncbi:MAG: penicillin-insensitive murein endopeptidase, partial [Sandaracinaceae bacterium]|nr:penicillin-insensitive murein endopeptidase [Sandaracinaceae bacterium]